jgi:hypothetical protein
MNMKNSYKHNDDGTTHIFIESNKNKYFPGKHTIIIDTEDFDQVKEHTWGLSAGAHHNYPYAAASILHPDGGWRIRPVDGCRERRRSHLFLHHLIVGKPQEGMVIDHQEPKGLETGLDNRKDNLREVDYSQNGQNSRSSRNSTSKYKGVYWQKANGKWAAKIGYKGKNIYLGSFTCEHEAARAYNKKALELWGAEYALLNNVPEGKCCKQ